MGPQSISLAEERAGVPRAQPCEGWGGVGGWQARGPPHQANHGRFHQNEELEQDSSQRMVVSVPWELIETVEARPSGPIEPAR